jgi:methyl-accepting chemotaxis protein
LRDKGFRISTEHLDPKKAGPPIASVAAHAEQAARPAEIGGTLRISFRLRLLLFWVAVAVVPLLALFVVTLNVTASPVSSARELRGLALGVALVSVASGGLISWMVGRNLLSWMRAHAAATEQVALENYDVRIREQRPDELGRLTDRFNDMTAALTFQKS